MTKRDYRRYGFTQSARERYVISKEWDRVLEVGSMIVVCMTFLFLGVHIVKAILR